MITVETANPKDPAPAALLAQSHALMNFVARDGAEVLGTGALALMKDYGEVKSMFTAETGRGKGVAAAVLRMVEDTAREEGMTSLRLETGIGLDAAHRLYYRFGFKDCGAFGNYTESPYSIFMEKTL